MKQEVKLHLGAEDEVVGGVGGDGDEVWGVIPSLSLFTFIFSLLSLSLSERQKDLRCEAKSETPSWS